jgi:hypothetical protein
MSARRATRESSRDRPRVRRWVGGLAVATIACAAHSLDATYYVSADATSIGEGSRAHPFRSLEDVERASRAGDTIIVLPSPFGVPPLDGGIALKPGQRLIGAGPAVIGRPPESAAPRIANTRDSRLAGDAVRLADATTVDNLVIASARRAGVYGLDDADVRIENNDIAAANESCTPGLSIHFPTQSTWTPLQNGFAAIMIDFDSVRTSVVVDGNFIHDSSCSDGIDVRAGGHADIFARIDGNVITRLKQGAAVGSLLGIGLQTRDDAALTVSSSHNAQTYLGNLFPDPGAPRGDAAWPAGDRAGADCEGVFTSQTGGTIVWNIDRNTFAHGIGGTSCNGAEFLVEMGAPQLHVIVRDSIFEDNPGDMIEENNLGTDSLMDVMLDNVTVRHATHVQPLQREPPVPMLALDTLTSRSVCMSQFSVGPRAVTRFAMTRSHFSDCAGDGILAFHASLPGLGAGPGAGSAIQIDHSSIEHVGEFALHWINYSALDDLELKVQGSRLGGAVGFAAVSVDQAPGARLKESRIDLGGGVLGSLGLNCFDNATAVAVSVPGGRPSYAWNWWGSPTGPEGRNAGEFAAGAVNAESLEWAPSSCETPTN